MSDDLGPETATSRVEIVVVISIAVAAVASTVIWGMILAYGLWSLVAKMF